MRSLRPCLVLLTVFAALSFAQQAVAGNWFLRMDVDGKRVEGLPIYWDEEIFYVLGRDGQLREFDIALSKKSQRIREPFRPFSQGEMRGQLAREFGKYFEITATGNYLVVHPIGESNKWPPRFEQLYREMLVYFGTRGIDTQKPQFPLVAVVLPNQATFMKYAAATGTKISGSVLGYYTPVSNRIFLYDASAGGRIRADWRQNAATLVHEAAHQTAWNVGLHKRLAVQPRWLTEGLGTLFEAPGVYDAGHNPARSDRVNRDRLDLYKQGVRQEGSTEGLADRADRLRSIVPIQRRCRLHAELGADVHIERNRALAVRSLPCAEPSQKALCRAVCRTARTRFSDRSLDPISR